MSNGNGSAGKKDGHVVKGYEELPLDRAEERSPVSAYVGRRSSPQDAPMTTRMKTQPYLGMPVGSPTQSGFRCQSIDLKDAQETQANAEQTSAEISAALAPNRVPDLSKLFDSVPEVGEYVENLPVFKPIEEPVKEVQTEVQDTLAGSVSIQGEGALPEPIRARIAKTEEPEIQIAPEPILPPPRLDNTSSTPDESLHIPPSAPTPSIDEKNSHQNEPPKRSFWGKVGNSLSSGWNAVTKTAKSVLRKPATAITLAAGLVVGSGAIVATSQMTDNSDSRQEEVAKTSAANTSPSKTSANQTGVVNLPPRVLEVESSPALDSAKTPEQKHEFSKTLMEAESPLIRRIVDSGKTTLRANLLGNTMIAPFAGIATHSQQAELSELTRSINLGMSVYFNEHFGTPEKVAESIKNPRLKNLYKSVKMMQAKGWVPPRLTKDKYPLEYKLASRIFADSEALGLDESDHPDQSVRDAVRGNIFRAKRPGAQINLKKADGSYHVVMELVFEIMNNHSAKDSMSQKLASVDSTRIHKGLESSDTPESRYAAAPQLPVNTLMQTTGVLHSTPVDTSDIDSGWGPPSTVELETASLAAPSITEMRNAFEKNLDMEVRVDPALSRMSQHKQVIEEVADQVAAMYPEADTEMVRGIVKRYGYIGFSIVSNDKEAGIFRIKYNRPSLQTLKWTINHRRGMRRGGRPA